MSQVINEALLALSIKRLKEEVSELKNTPQPIQGETGTQGPAGQQGLQGERGPKGERGDRGVKGDRGLTGIKGDKGIKGDAGPQGDPGPIGPKGDKGDRGSKGDKGDVGLTGATGAMGLQGPMGPMGPKGDQGDAGPQGVAGVDGKDGINGIDGAMGPIGPKGDKGDRGPQGLKGDKGDRGDKGDKGDIGLQGPEGPSGKSVTLDDVTPIFDKYRADYQAFIKTVGARTAAGATLGIGGGGEVWLQNMADVNKKSVTQDGYFLKYDAATKRFVGAPVSGEGLSVTGVDSDAIISLIDSDYILARIPTNVVDSDRLVNHLLNLTHDLIPALDSSYSIGSPTKKWKDLYLSGNTINLGPTSFKVNNNSGGVDIVSVDGSVSSLAVSNITAIPGSTGDFDMKSSFGDTSGTLIENTFGDNNYGPFGEDLRSVYDCLEPKGSVKSLDLGGLT